MLTFKTKSLKHKIFIHGYKPSIIKINTTWKSFEHIIEKFKKIYMISIDLLKLFNYGSLYAWWNKLNHRYTFTYGFDHEDLKKGKLKIIEFN